MRIIPSDDINPNDGLLRNILILFIFLPTLLLLSCSTPEERLPVIHISHAKTPLTIGRLSQALDYLTVLTLRQGASSRAFPVILAHAVSIFYGFEYQEANQNEQELLLKWCANLRLKTSAHPWSCWKSLVERITEDASSAIPVFESAPKYEDKAKDLSTMMTGALEGSPFPVTPPVYMEVFPTIMNLKKVPEKALYRIPAGAMLALTSMGMWRIGEEASYSDLGALWARLKTPISDGGEISVAVSSPLKTVKLLSYLTSRGLNGAVLWFRHKNLYLGIKVRLEIDSRLHASLDEKTATHMILDAIRDVSSRTFHLPKPSLFFPEHSNPVNNGHAPPQNKLPSGDTNTNLVSPVSDTGVVLPKPPVHDVMKISPSSAGPAKRTPVPPSK